MWIPRFSCPRCRLEVERAGVDRHVCRACECAYEQRDGIWRFLTPGRERALEPFVRQYRAVRDRDGYRSPTAESLRALPAVDEDDPHADTWRIRAESYRHFHRSVLASRRGALRVLDLGAGNGWLSHRLAAIGHHVVAVDALDDPGDGLGAVHQYLPRFVAVQGDFDVLPLLPRQFDVVVFNGSLHYARDVAATLAEAERMIAPGGALVVMDSPMFRRDRDGRAMVDDTVRRFESDYRLAEVVHPGPGYLTFTALDRVADRCRLRARFIPSRGPLGWRAGRALARLRLRRAPAAFGVWVAQ